MSPKAGHSSRKVHFDFARTFGAFDLGPLLSSSTLLYSAMAASFSILCVLQRQKGKEVMVMQVEVEVEVEGMKIEVRRGESLRTL